MLFLLVSQFSSTLLGDLSSLKHYSVIDLGNSSKKTLGGIGKSVMSLRK